MASLNQWTWVWANSRRQWRTGRLGVLQFVGSQSWTQLSDWTRCHALKNFAITWKSLFPESPMEVYPLNTCKELLNEQEINFIMLTLECISSLLPQWGNFVKIPHNLFSNLLSFQHQHREGIPVYLISFLFPKMSYAFSLLYICIFPFLSPSLTPVEILLHSRPISCLFPSVKSSRPFQFPTISSIIPYLFSSHLHSWYFWHTHEHLTLTDNTGFTSKLDYGMGESQSFEPNIFLQTQGHISVKIHWMKGRATTYNELQNPGKFFRALQLQDADETAEFRAVCIPLPLYLLGFCIFVYQLNVC